MNEPCSSASIVLWGRSTGHTAIARSSAMPAAGARAATRSAKLPPSEKPASVMRRVRERSLDRAHRADDLIEPARVEDLLVEVMARAVVAEIQAKDVAAELEQIAAERQHVHRIRAALPAVQQDRQLARRRASRGGLARVVAEQAHAVAAIDDLCLGARRASGARGASQRPAQPQARHDRLQVRVGEPAAGAKSIALSVSDELRAAADSVMDRCVSADEPGRVRDEVGAHQQRWGGEAGFARRLSTVPRIPSEDCTVNEYPLAVRRRAVFDFARRIARLAPDVSWGCCRAESGPAAQSRCRPMRFSDGPRSSVAAAADAIQFARRMLSTALRRDRREHLDVRDAGRVSTRCSHRPTECRRRASRRRRNRSAASASRVGSATILPSRRTREPSPADSIAVFAVPLLNPARPVEAEREMRRVRHCFLELRGDAVGRHHIEADAGAQHDARALRFLVRRCAPARTRRSHR